MVVTAGKEDPMVAPLGGPLSAFLFNQTQRAFNQAAQFANQLSTGLRVNSAADDAAALAIGTRLNADSAAFNAIQSNIPQAQAALRTSDGALSNLQDILTRANQLAVQAGSSNIGDFERGLLDTEFQNLLAEADRIVQDTDLGDLDLLGVPGGQTLNFRVGTGINPAEDAIGTTLPEATVADLGLSGASIATQAGADAAIGLIRPAIDAVTAARTEVGAADSRLGFAAQSVATTALNTEEASANLLGADFARAIEAFTRAQNLLEANIGASALNNSLIRQRVSFFV